MNEFVSSKIEFTIDGKPYKMRLPTHLELLEYREEQSLADNDEKKIYHSVSKFLDKLGLPIEDSNKIESGILFKILELIASKKI